MDTLTDITDWLLSLAPGQLFVLAVVTFIVGFAAYMLLHQWVWGVKMKRRTWDSYATDAMFAFRQLGLEWVKDQLKAEGERDGLVAEIELTGEKPIHHTAVTTRFPAPLSHIIEVRTKGFFPTKAGVEATRVGDEHFDPFFEVLCDEPEAVSLLTIEARTALAEISRRTGVTTVRMTETLVECVIRERVVSDATLLSDLLDDQARLVRTVLRCDAASLDPK